MATVISLHTQLPVHVGCDCARSGERTLVPHGDHLDQLCAGRLHHACAAGCEDHGPADLGEGARALAEALTNEAFEAYCLALRRAG